MRELSGTLLFGVRKTSLGAGLASPGGSITAFFSAVGADEFRMHELPYVRSHAQREWRFTNHRRAVILFLIVLVLSETVLVLVLEIES